MLDSCLGSALLPIHLGLSARGLEADAIAQGAGIDPVCLREPGARVSCEAADRFWRQALCALHGDTAFALELARHMRPAFLHGAGIAWLASATLEDALKGMQRHRHSIHSIGRLTIRAERDQVWLVVEATSTDAAACMSSSARLACLLSLCRELAGEALRPVAVRLRHARQAQEALQADPFADFYGVTPAYGAAEYALALARAEWRRPLPGSNPPLLLAAEHSVRDYCAALKRSNIPGRVRQAISACLREGEISRAAVAHRLRLSERTLHRRLAALGLDFSRMLDDMRQELACRMLREGAPTIQEVAWRLGFAEIASFSRAFRRWTGLSPSAWRALQAA